MTPRSILHVDLDAFFCSVEEILDPTLIGKAFVVGGRPSRSELCYAWAPSHRHGFREVESISSQSSGSLAR